MLMNQINKNKQNDRVQPVDLFCFSMHFNYFFQFTLLLQLISIIFLFFQLTIYEINFLFFIL